jgi:uncharacterized protein YndB with AHSA1/START domain
MNDLVTAVDPGALRLERVLPGPIERVWAYLTESDKRATWLAAGDFDLRKGGAIELRFHHANLSREKETPARHKDSENARFTGVVTRCEAPRVLSFTWNMGEEDSEVTFELAPRGNDVLLVVTHRRLEGRVLRVNVASGWDAHVGILEDRLRGVEPRPFWSTHARLEREYEGKV